jgi:hypothetical protein
LIAILSYATAKPVASGGNILAGSFEKLNNVEDETGLGWFPESWSQVLVRPEVLDIFFHLRHVMHESDHQDTAGKCIHQLSGVHGPVFLNETTERAYAGHLMQGLQRMIAAQVLMCFSGLFLKELRHFT